jgi:hypothetical protein
MDFFYLPFIDVGHFQTFEVSSSQKLNSRSRYKGYKSNPSFSLQVTLKNLKIKKYAEN